MTEIYVDIQHAHASTEACLEALQWLHERIDPKQVLEIGCGNGILSITAATIWDTHVLAADLAPLAVEDATKSTIASGLQDRMQVVRSEGFSHPALMQGAPYDLVICNLLPDTLLGLAHGIKKASLAGGFMIMAGILSWRVAEIREAYSNLGFDIAHEIVNSPWHCFILCNRSEI